MNILHQIFSHYYAIPFAFSFFMPPRRSLAGLAAILAALVLWMNLSGNNGPDATPVSVLLFILTFLGGLFSGMRARAILLRLPKKAKNAVALMGFLGAGFVLLPGSRAADAGDTAHSATMKLRKWQMRAPSEVCLTKKYAVQVAGATYYLPPAPVISIRSGRTSHHFQYNNDIRAMCEKFKDAGEPLHVEDLSMDFSIPMKPPFCQATQSPWGRALCSRDPKAADGAYPAIANIYSPAEYDKKHLMASYSYANFVADRDRAMADKHPFESQPVGIFDRYANGYWVARSGTWTNDAGEPFTLRCQDASPRGTVSCTTSYRLKTGPQVTYHFSAPAKKVEAVAKKVDGNFRSMITEFSAP